MPDGITSVEGGQNCTAISKDQGEIAIIRHWAIFLGQSASTPNRLSSR